MTTNFVVVARNVAWLAGGEVTLKGGLLLAGVVVARGMGPEGMGVFTVAYGAALVLMQVLAGGQPAVLIRETARSPSQARDLFRVARGYQAILAAVVLPIGALLALAVPQAGLRWTLISFLVYAWLRAALVTGGSVFKGLDRMEVEVIGRTVELSVALALLVLACRAGLSPWITGLAFTAGGLLGVAWVGLRLRTLPVSGSSPLPRSALIREGFPFLGLTTLVLLTTRADSFLLAAFGVPEGEIGWYGVAVAPVLALGAGLQILASAVYPLLSRQALRGPLNVRWVAAVAGGGAVAGALLGCTLWAIREPLVLLLFGAEFEPSVRLLGVLAWAVPGTGAASLSGVLVAALRRQKWSLVSEGSVLVVVMLALAAAIPRWGVSGCAVVMVGGQWALAIATVCVALLVARMPARDPLLLS